MAFLALATVPALLIAAAVGVASYRFNVQRTEVAIAGTAAAVARDVENWIEKHRAAVALAATAPGLAEDYGEDKLLNWLRALRDQYPTFLTSIATDAEGTVIAAHPRTNVDGTFDFWRGQTVADRAYFREPRRSLQPYVSDVFRGRTYATDAVIAVSAPVHRAGEFLGVLEGSLDLKGFANFHESVTRARGFELVVLDASDMVAYASEALGAETGASAATIPWLSLPDAAPAREPAFVTLHHPTAGRFLATQARTAAGWRVAVLAPRAAITGFVWIVLGYVAALLAMTFAVVMLLTPRAIASITRPIQRLVYRMNAHRGGARIDDPAEPLDEQALPRELEPIRASFVQVTGELERAAGALQRTLTREQSVRAELELVLKEREDEIMRRTRELEFAVRALKDQSEHDGLTGLANYRRYRAELERMWVHCRAEHQAIAALALDIDHFKQFNDTYGHLAGDECLRQVGAALARALAGDADVIARSGGEEFVALFQDANRRAVLAAAEKVRLAIEALRIPHDKAPGGIVTTSVGVSIVVPKDPLKADALMRGADLALYRAKRGGRNRVAEMSPALLQRPRE